MKHVRIHHIVIAVLYFYSIAAMAISIKLVETSPKSPAELSPNETIYVLIHYKSDKPLRFQAVGNNKHQEVIQNARLNPSQAYPAGTGDAIAWVAYTGATEIDSVVITVYDANWQKLQTQSIAMAATWEQGNASLKQPLASWVAKLNQQQQNQVSRGQQDSSFIGTSLLVQLLFLSIPLYWFLQIRCLLKWRDEWKRAAYLPFLISLPVLLYTIYALYAGSNLWPLMLLFITPAALIFLLLIMGYKKWATESRPV